MVMHAALAGLWNGVGEPADAPRRVEIPAGSAVLPSIFAVDSAAAASVAATTLAAAELWRARGGAGSGEALVSVDARAAAVAFRSERYLRVDGRAPKVWDDLTGDYRARDGWVRLHCNYPVHRAGALAALGLRPADAVGAEVASAVAIRDAVEVEEAVLAAGGAAAALRTADQWAAHPQGAAVAALPLVGIIELAGTKLAGTKLAGIDPAGRQPRPLAPAQRPLAGVRVLDLTRVIAGPVAGRTLAAHGAEVLRVGADHLALVAPLVIDTGFGKRFCHLDLRLATGREALRGLIAEADVVLQAYRPGALERLGFGPAECAAIRPGLVYVDICAWGQAGPWRQRRGFDSLVQMACGIADAGRVAAGDHAPRPLPAQALDHATGYLAALGAMVGLRRRHIRGGSWHVQVSLTRTARWLDDLGRVPGGLAVPDPGPADVADLLAEMDSPFGQLTYVRPAGMIAGAPLAWSTPPHRPGADPPLWMERPAD
jgi:hypothetical protein